MKKIINLFGSVMAVLCLIFTAAIDVRAYAFDDRAVIPDDYTVNDATQGDARDGAYNVFFPTDDIQEVRISVDEDLLSQYFKNADKKPSVLCESVTVGSDTVKYVGMKTKGDHTLEDAVADEDSHRYSFTINFGKYIKKDEYGKKQNFYGLNKVSFNNFYYDKSMLKEYCAFTLFHEMNVPASQFTLAKVYINDEYYGVYFMVEALDLTILQQYYGMKKKDLGAYLAKPQDTRLQYEEIISDPGVLYNHDEDTYEDVKVDLDLVTEAIRKLNLLSSGRDFDGNEIDVNSQKYLELLDSVINTDECLRYFAVNSFLVQTNNMFTKLHNYGLYCDRNGRLAILPWDYDLSFGTYYPLTADETANYDVDIMYTTDDPDIDYGKEGFREEFYSQFPIFNVIYQNERLMDKYYSYLMDCAKICLLGGRTNDNKTYDPAYMSGLIDGILDKLIAAASIKNADGAGYLNRIWQPSDIKKAIPELKKIVADRALGVYLQLSGPDSSVTCGNLDLSAVGNGLGSAGRSTGYLSTVDPDTGIFVTADYEGGTPGITVTATGETDAGLEKIKNEIQGAEDITVFSIKDGGYASSDYLVTIPAGSKRLNAGTRLALYSYEDGKIKELTTERNGNLLSASVSSLDRIVLAKINDLPVSDDTEDKSVMDKETLFVGAIAAGMLALAIVIVELTGRLRRKKKADIEDEWETKDIQNAEEPDMTEDTGKKETNRK